jgi:hypothetical protein
VLGVPLGVYDRLRDVLGLNVPAGAIKRIFTGLTGILLSGAVLAILRRRR